MKTARPSKVLAPRKGATRREWALHCASLGLRVHPLYWPTKTGSTPEEALCSCKNKTCGKRTGKHPIEKDWQKKATTDTEQIEAWWSEHPDANIGVYTGTGELLVIDLDGADGHTSIVALERQHDPIPKTLKVATGHGVHLYFAKPPGTSKIRNRTRILPGVDVRADGADGAYVVGPGSLHWSGATYDLKVSSSIAPAPEWLLAFVTESSMPAVDTPCGAATVVPVEDPQVARVPLDERTRRALAYVEKAAIAVCGAKGHSTAMRVATAVVRGFALPAEAARGVLDEWNRRCEPPWSERELSHKIEEATRVGAVSWGAKLIATSDGFAPQSIVTLARSHPREELTYLLPHFKITSGRPTLLGGFGGVGKTLLAQELVLAVATRRARCWGDVEIESERSRVLHLDYEMGGKAVVDRYRRLAAGMGLSLLKRGADLHVESMPRLYLSDDPRQVEAALLNVCDDVGLVVVDSLRAACPGAKSENDSAMRLYLDVLTRVSEVTGSLFVVVVHEGKQQADGSGRQGSQRVRGSGAIIDAAGAILSVSARQGGLRIEQTKASFGPPGPNVRVRLLDGETKTGKPALAVVKVEDEKDDGASVISESSVVAKRITAMVGENPGIKVSELIDRVKGRRTTIEKTLKKLREEGVVLDEPGAHGAKRLKLASGGGDDDAP